MAYRRKGAVLLLALAAAVVGPHNAQAYWRGGGVFFGFGPPVYYYSPPVYYAPPVVYAAPPVVYERPHAGEPAVPMASCDAGPYVCPLDRPIAIGSPCSCPTRGGGRAGGLAR